LRTPIVKHPSILIDDERYNMLVGLKVRRVQGERLKNSPLLISVSAGSFVQI
jgi:hypothetical protein